MNCTKFMKNSNSLQTIYKPIEDNNMQPTVSVCKSLLLRVKL